MNVNEYDRASAAEYAKKWALGRNPKYYNFDAIGGDCTNFVSQCIYAGAKVMNYTKDTGWYYNSLSDRAPAWSGVEYLAKFLTSNKSVGPFAREASFSEIEYGDIIQLGNSDGYFYHSLFVLKKTEYNAYAAAHTYDVYMKPLGTYSYDNARYLHIEGARVW